MHKKKFIFIFLDCNYCTQGYYVKTQCEYKTDSIEATGTCELCAQNTYSDENMISTAQSPTNCSECDHFCELGYEVSINFVWFKIISEKKKGWCL
jgi:hypothetical protein